MSKLECLIKLRIGYYNSMLDVLSAEDPDEYQKTCSF